MSDYFFKKNLAQLMRKPADQGATPTADRLVAATAAGVARRNASLTDQAKTRNLKQVQFDRNIDLRRGYHDLAKEELDTAGKQNRMATAIGVGNLAITGAAGVANAKLQDKNDAMMDRYAQMQKDLLDMTRAFTTRYLTLSKGGTS